MQLLLGPYPLGESATNRLTYKYLFTICSQPPPPPPPLPPSPVHSHPSCSLYPHPSAFPSPSLCPSPIIPSPHLYHSALPSPALPNKGRTREGGGWGRVIEVALFFSLLLRRALEFAHLDAKIIILIRLWLQFLSKIYEKTEDFAFDFAFPHGPISYTEFLQCHGDAVPEVEQNMQAKWCIRSSAFFIYW